MVGGSCNKQKRRDPAEDQGCKLWHPPQRGLFKCNTDAAVDARGNRTGAGMIICGDEGQLLKYRMSSWGGVWRSKEVEAQALLEALSWKEQEGLAEVTFETDARVVVNALSSLLDNTSEFGDLLRSYRAVLIRHPNFVVNFIRRDRNRVAHTLAKRSISFLKPVCGSDSPEWLDDVLAEQCLIDHES
ncbi:hypothetical protein LINPERPRIM_LOCUS21274 [Linum perenne]